VAAHLIRRTALMDEQQHLQQPPNGVLLLVAVTNAGMLDAPTCENKKIVVMGDDDSLLGESVRDVIFVASPQQCRFGSRCHVHPVTSKTNGEHRPNTFVKMIPDHPNRPCRGRM